jgi:sugar/nucleoside kinase (ribokinase family)
VGVNADFDGTEADLSGASLVHLGYPSLLPHLVEDGGAALIRFLERAHRYGATTSVDLAVIDPMTKSGKLDWKRILREAMPSIDVISPSVDDLRSALNEPNATAPTLVELLLDWGAGVVAVSDGKNGVFVGVAGAERLARGGLALAPLTQTWAGARINQPSVHVRRVATTNGAGDAATAGLISAIVTREMPAAAALRSATTAAAIIQGDLPTAVV